MIFDSLINFCEKHDTGMLPILRRVKLFHIPINPHEVLPKSYGPDQEQFFQDNFFLPFQHIAVEDNASCVVIWDAEPNQIGLDRERFWIDCMALDYRASKEAFSDQNDPSYWEWAKGNPKGSVVLVFGTIRSIQIRASEDIYIDVSFKGIVGGNKDSMTLDAARGKQELSRLAKEDKLERLAQNVKTGIEELIYFNQADMFAVERSAVKPRHQGSARIARSQDRPIFTWMRAKQIREVLNFESTGIHRAAHERRAHYRVLRSEYFKHKQGQRIIIPSTWIGPEEAVIGNKRYRVHKDLLPI